MRKLFCVFLATSVAGFLVGCGDDTSGAMAQDGGHGDVVQPTPEGGGDVQQPPSDGGVDVAQPATDSGDAACDFGAFVLDLIQNHSNDPMPSSNLGQNCTDKQDQAQFKPLFP